MSEQFKDQGGVATMDPSHFLRWMTSRLMTRLSRPAAVATRQAKAERIRVKTGSPHRVDYFHQVDEAYSHLTAQLLVRLAERYNIELHCHLVRGQEGRNAPEPELLSRLARYDAHLIAPGYGLSFAEHPEAPEARLVQLATCILAAQSAVDFPRVVLAVSEAVWRGDGAALEHLAADHGVVTPEEASVAVEAGTAKRRELKHYSGAMFHYGGEWYWGIDRLYHLEERLACLLAGEQPGMPICFPRPKIENGPLKDDGSLTLEFYPTLRSPYTSIIFERVVKLASDTGIALRVLPVLPMVMRGVPTTKNKGAYIFWDAAREARSAGVPFGKIYDPVGRPVRRCYSLYPWAAQQGKGVDLLGSFLKAVMSEGVNCNNDRGLRLVVERAGLNWSDARKYIGDSEWVQLLEDNRRKLYSLGIWGTPSFRLLDNKGVQKSAWWGQDRLWIVSREVQQLLSLRNKQQIY